MVRKRFESDDPSSKRIASLYARVSSKEQEKEGFSIPSQLRVLRSYACTASLNVVREFVDVETAKETGRSGFNEMVAFLKKTPSCQVVLVEKTDRLYRNLKDWVTLDELNLEIHFAKENVVLSRDSRSSEKFMHGIKVLMAKNYIDNLSEETQKGMHEKAAQGLWPSCAPLGYRNVQGSNGKKTIEPDPDSAPMVTRLFEHYATGLYSLKEVTRMAKDEGMVFRKSKNPIPRATVHKILRNLIYTGQFAWNGKIYQGAHTPLVSLELWQRVQAALEQRLVKRHRKVKHDFAFSGLIYCGHCGCALVGEIKKRKYIYYHCTGYRGRCLEPYVREEVIEGLFGGLLEQLRLDNEVVDWVREALRQSQQDERRSRHEAVARLQIQYDTLQGRIEAMYIDRLDGRIDATFFDRKAFEWRNEQGRLTREIQAHRESDQVYLSEGIRLLELAGRARELFLIQPAREKRRLLNFLLSNCTWKEGELDATFRQPFDMLRDTIKTQSRLRSDAGLPQAGFENWLPGLDSN
jgi:site-specific DNA recombinase